VNKTQQVTSCLSLSVSEGEDNGISVIAELCVNSGASWKGMIFRKDLDYIHIYIYAYIWIGGLKYIGITWKKWTTNY